MGQIVQGREIGSVAGKARGQQKSDYGWPMPGMPPCCGLLKLAGSNVENFVFPNRPAEAERWMCALIPALPPIKGGGDLRPGDCAMRGDACGGLT